MRNIIYFFLLSVSIVLGQNPMSTSEANALKEMVKSRALTTKTISSDFTQYKHLDFLENDIVTKGKLTFKSPNSIKWEYTEPFKYAVIFKNESLFINDEGNKSEIDIGSSKMFKQLNTLIIKSVKGDMFDDTEFDITYLKKDSEYLIQFKPKDGKLSKYIIAFHISFNEEGDVEQVKMIEPSGDFTKIVFSNKTLNNPVSDAVFNN